MRQACILAAVLALAACAKADGDPGPADVTIGEARALDDAAQMLDSRQPSSEPASDAADASTP